MGWATLGEKRAPHPLGWRLGRDIRSSTRVLSLGPPVHYAPSCPDPSPVMLPSDVASVLFILTVVGHVVVVLMVRLPGLLVMGFLLS